MNELKLRLPVVLTLPESNIFAASERRRKA